MTDDSGEERWRYWKRVDERNCLLIYVIYERPTDYPEHFVVRRWKVVGGTHTPEKFLMTSDTLDEARGCVPPGLMKFGREIIDDPCIVESWL